jgi:2-aminoadipate transaminase
VYAERMRRVAASAIMELIKTTAGGSYISFASGLPDPSLFPSEALRECADAVLSSASAPALQYGPAEGYPPLREAVAALLSRRGLETNADQVLITSGSQQALDLAGRALLDPNDGVAIESPSYLAALQIFDSLQARYHAVEVDGEGPLPTHLTVALSHRPKLLYLLPNFQNPTGTTMSLGRRQAAAEQAASAGVAVLEDDAYHDLRYDGEPLAPVAALAENPWAIYTGTFSKTIAPGVRVGYLRADRRLIERLAHLKQITDLQAGSLAQRIVFEYLTRGHLEPGIERFREVYRRRRDLMLGALQEHLRGAATWTRPAGGMFIWVTLPAEDAERVLEGAMRRGVLFVPGSTFHVDRTGGRGRNTLRLNFVSPTEDQIQQGIPLLAEAIRETQG